MSELILKEDALNCFHDWIDMYGYEHTADEDPVYQRIEALDTVRCCDEDCISRRVAIEAIDDIESEVADGFGFQYEKWREYFCELPAVQSDHNADVSKKVDEMISRRVAIDAVHKSYDTILDFKSNGSTVADSFEDIINALPTVQPEIIRCEDCIHYNEYEDCIKYQRDGFCSEWARNTYKYWYCSRAERRKHE